MKPVVRQPAWRAILGTPPRSAYNGADMKHFREAPHA